jgi:hypothetical protein
MTTSGVDPLFDKLVFAQLSQNARTQHLSSRGTLIAAIVRSKRCCTLLMAAESSYIGGSRLGRAKAYVEQALRCFNRSISVARHSDVSAQRCIQHRRSWVFN